MTHKIKYPSAKAAHAGGGCTKNCYYCQERSWLAPKMYHYPAKIYAEWCRRNTKAQRKGPLPKKMEY